MTHSAMEDGCPDCGLAPHQIVGFPGGRDDPETHLKGYCNDCGRDWPMDMRVPLREDPGRER